MIVPLSTKAMMIEKLKEAGAVEVIQIGSTWRDADKYLREEVLGKQLERKQGKEGKEGTEGKEGKEKGIYVPPFDHETLWDAAAMIIEEVERQLVTLQPVKNSKGKGKSKEEIGGGKETTKDEMIKRISPDIVICSTGGGGLFSGLNLGISKSSISRTNTIMISSETIGAESLYSSIQSGQHISIPGITSIATSLGAVQVCQKAFEYGMNKDKVTCLTVTDKQAVSALIKFGDMERILVEPACGAALAVVYERDKFEEVIKKSLGKGKKKEELKVVVVVCGGSNVSLGMINEWKEMFDL